MAGLAKDANETQIVNYIGSHYGADIAAFLRIPELRKIIIAAAEGDWGEALVSTKLRRTQWYRTRSESMRTYDALRVADPMEYKRLVAQKQAQIQGTMESLGLTNSKGMAEMFLRAGFDDAQIRKNFADQQQQISGQRGLAAGSDTAATADQLMAIARQEYLTPIDRQTAERWAIRAFRSGEPVEDAFRSYLGQVASVRFGIDPASGITPADVMAPARQAIAESLERNPDSIDFTRPEYSDVLQVETSDHRFRPMTAHEATVWARGQDGFKTTKTAEDATAEVTNTLATTFGLVGS